MLAISPPFFGYPLEDLRSHEPNNHHMLYNGETEETSESLLNSPTFQQQRIRQDDGDECKPFSLINDESKMVKKINHNASERDRRKKINGLYTSLRSLLPAAYQEKKLSIPSTISRVLKYIPQLQSEMDSLTKKKEGLIRRISEQENSKPLKKQRKCSTQSSSSSTISATQISDRDVMIQIAALKFGRCTYAEVLSRLEQGGLILLNSSCFESSQERVFYNLHLQMCEAQVMDLEGLRKQLQSLYDQKQEQPLLSNFSTLNQLGDFFVN